MNIFEKLKDNLFKQRKITNDQYVEKLNISLKNKIRTSKEKKREADAKILNYTIFLPKAKIMGKSMYDQFLRTFL